MLEVEKKIIHKCFFRLNGDSHGQRAKTPSPGWQIVPDRGTVRAQARPLRNHAGLVISSTIRAPSWHADLFSGGVLHACHTGTLVSKTSKPSVSVGNKSEQAATRLN